MSQTSEEQQNSTEQSRIRRWSGQKIQAVAAAIVAFVALLIVPVLAWFSFQRNIHTITKIREPQALVIGAGNAKAVTELELNDIDVSGEKKYKDIVFCIYSPQSLAFNLQLAHTTNTGFTYAIYPAKRTAMGGSSTISYLNETYYFNENSPVSGSYLNLERDSSPARATASGEYHNNSYAKSDGSGVIYDNVQPNAEPLYWKTNGELHLPNNMDDTGYYINYYVLRISWDNSAKNNKETDMVYLMAEATGSSESS